MNDKLVEVSNFEKFVEKYKQINLPNLVLFFEKKINAFNKNNYDFTNENIEKILNSNKSRDVQTKFCKSSSKVNAISFFGIENNNEFILLFVCFSPSLLAIVSIFSSTLTQLNDDLEDKMFLDCLIDLGENKEEMEAKIESLFSFNFLDRGHLLICYSSGKVLDLLFQMVNGKEYNKNEKEKLKIEKLGVVWEDEDDMMVTKVIHNAENNHLFLIKSSFIIHLVPGEHMDGSVFWIQFKLYDLNAVYDISGFYLKKEVKEGNDKEFFLIVSSLEGKLLQFSLKDSSVEEISFENNENLIVDLMVLEDFNSSRKCEVGISLVACSPSKYFCHRINKLPYQINLYRTTPTEVFLNKLFDENFYDNFTHLFQLYPYLFLIKHDLSKSSSLQSLINSKLQLFQLHFEKISLLGLKIYWFLLKLLLTNSFDDEKNKTNENSFSTKKMNELEKKIRKKIFVNHFKKILSILPFETLNSDSLEYKKDVSRIKCLLQENFAKEKEVKGFKERSGVKNKTDNNYSESSLSDRCQICKTPIIFSSFSKVLCSNNHSFFRCVQSLRVVSGMDRRVCKVCKSFALPYDIFERNNLDGALVYLLSDKCTFCDGPLKSLTSL